MSLAAPRTTSPAGLAPGDVVLLDGERFEVVGLPFVGRSGSSVFDESTLFWRVRLRALREPREVVYGTWPVGAAALVAQAS